MSAASFTLHAQLFAKAMKFVGPIRKALPFPTFFNLLGPIINPSKPQCQLLGTATLDQMRLYNQVYQRLGIDYGIVNSIDGYDEISLPATLRLPRTTMRRYSNRLTSASPMPSLRRSSAVPRRRKQRKSLTMSLPTRLFLLRRTLFLPMQPSVSRSLRRERRISVSA